MIFVTVGTQLPFDRMVRTIDAWAGANGRTDVFAQVGPSDYRPQHIGSAPFLSADECRARVESCSAVVAHAGMGSILTALELGKPIVVMPRRAEFREHRNDHQLATAKRFLAQGRIIVAFDEQHLVSKLDELDRYVAADRIAARASPRLIQALRGFVESGEMPVPTSAEAETCDPRPAVTSRAARRRPMRIEPIGSLADSAGLR